MSVIGEVATGASGAAWSGDEELDLVAECESFVGALEDADLPLQQAIQARVGEHRLVNALLERCQYGDFSSDIQTVIGKNILNHYEQNRSFCQTFLYEMISQAIHLGDLPLYQALEEVGLSQVDRFDSIEGEPFMIAVLKRYQPYLSKGDLDESRRSREWLWLHHAIASILKLTPDEEYPQLLRFACEHNLSTECKLQILSCDEVGISQLSLEQKAQLLAEIDSWPVWSRVSPELRAACDQEIERKIDCHHLPAVPEPLAVPESLAVPAPLAVPEPLAKDEVASVSHLSPLSLIDLGIYAFDRSIDRLFQGDESKLFIAYNCFG